MIALGLSLSSMEVLCFKDLFQSKEDKHISIHWDFRLDISRSLQIKRPGIEENLWKNNTCIHVDVNG